MFFLYLQVMSPWMRFVLLAGYGFLGTVLSVFIKVGVNEKRWDVVVTTAIACGIVAIMIVHEVRSWMDQR